MQGKFHFLLKGLCQDLKTQDVSFPQAVHSRIHRSLLLSFIHLNTFHYTFLSNLYNPQLEPNAMIESLSHGSCFGREGDSC